MLGAPPSGAGSMDFTSAAADGQHFAFADSGEGPLVLLLHGFPDTPHGWAATRDALNRAGYRTVVPTCAATTRTPSSRVAGTAVARSQRTRCGCSTRSAPIEPCSWATTGARRSPTAPRHSRASGCGRSARSRSRNRDLQKPSPALAWRGRHFLTLRLPTGRWLARRRDYAYIDTLMSRWAPNWSGPARDACLRDVKRCFGDPRVLDAALAYYRNASRERLGRLAQPALIVGGTSDIVDPEAFTRSPEAFDGPCDVLIADGAGHWLHREAAALFEERLVAFLASLP